MVRFPRSEAQALALAQELVTGLSNNVGVYPSSPISVMDLATTIGAHTSAKNAAIAAQVAAEQATSDLDHQVFGIQHDRLSRSNRVIAGRSLNTSSKGASSCKL